MGLSDGETPAGRRLPPTDKAWRVMILGAGDKLPVREEADHVRRLIHDETNIVAFDLNFEQSLSETKADLAIVLGGDGSILRAARQMGTRQVPVLGINLGKLGFLANVSPENVEDAWQTLRDGDYVIKDCLMLNCQIYRKGKLFAQELALNEIALLSSLGQGILDIELYVDEEHATTYSCDGLLLSTPVGSTAHNLSAGGPIIRQDLHAVVISPISPHTLTVRPVVDRADRIYELMVPSLKNGAALVADGQIVIPLGPEDRVRVTQAKACFQMIEVGGQTYYRTLRDKLGWRGQPNYR
ncbi:NAD kinase [Planctomycetales bacterium 10988]|nr:NAD kinase [Planctomycetales bacterium 10988]